MRWPSLTPAGTRTLTSRGRSSLPVPRHVGHGRSTTMPRPPHCGQGAEEVAEVVGIADVEREVAALGSAATEAAARAEAAEASAAHRAEPADLVVLLAFGGVAEHVPGRRDVLELLLVTARVGMVL